MQIDLMAGSSTWQKTAELARRVQAAGFSAFPKHLARWGEVAKAAA